MKNKKITKIFLGLVIVLLGLLVVGCKDDKKKPEPAEPEEPTVYPIGLDIKVDKSEYAINEEYISNVTASAKYNDGTTKDVTSNITIDTSKFDKTKDGTYEIIVSYVEGKITAKSFFLAKVGTGKVEDDNPDVGDDTEIFGPGTYVLDAIIELENYMQSQAIPTDTKFGGGFYQMKGTGAKRANASAYAIELGKAESSWIEFEVTGTATVSIECSSTGSANSSAIAVFDSENSVVTNNENITIVEGTDVTIITYTLTTGTYRLLSQAGTVYSTRGVRVYKVTVTQA